MTSSTNSTQHLLKFKVVPTYVCTLHNKLERMVVKIKPHQELAIIKVDVITSLVRNLMHRERHPHNCIKMANKLLEEKSKDQVQQARVEAVVHIE